MHWRKHIHCKFAGCVNDSPPVNIFMINQVVNAIYGNDCLEYISNKMFTIKYLKSKGFGKYEYLKHMSTEIHYSVRIFPAILKLKCLAYLCTA